MNLFDMNSDVITMNIDGKDIEMRHPICYGKEYDKWGKENTHLPNIQPSSQIVARLKAQKNQANTNAPVQNAQPSNIDVSKINSMDAKIQALEVKVDKIISHFGIN